jgi:S1-C subfamily serine protease
MIAAPQFVVFTTPEGKTFNPAARKGIRVTPQEHATETNGIRGHTTICCDGISNLRFPGVSTNTTTLARTPPMTAVLMMLMAADPSGANQSGVLLLDFTAGYCQPCQQMVPSLQRMEKDGFPIRKVDITRDHQLSQQYGVERIPTLVLLVNGREVKRFVGLTAESELRRAMNNAARALQPKQSAESEPEPRVTAETFETPRGTPAVAGRAPSSRSFADRLKEFFGAGGSREDNLTIRGQDPGSQTAAPSDGLVKAFAATVRIRVSDSRREDVGSGTIIHSQSGNSYILTCAHLFAGFHEDAAIKVDVFSADQQKQFPAQIVGGDHNSDLALIRIQNAEPLAQVRLTGNTPPVAPDQILVSFGCNRGANPSPLQTRVSKLRPYLGPASLTCETPPEKGRSGGGLFDDNGTLIGVCSAADPERNEGLYMAHEAVIDILQHCQVTDIVPGGIPTKKSTADTRVAGNTANPPAQQGENPFADSAANGTPSAEFASISNAAGSGLAAPATPTASSQTGGPEITVVIDPQTPGGQKRVVVIPQASAWLVELITGETAQPGAEISVVDH